MPTTSERGQYQRFDEPPHLPDGTVDPLALVVLSDMMPGSVAERLGNPIEHAWYGPSADLTVHLLGTARSEWLYSRTRARQAADGYASIENEIWDPEVGLVAYGTQTMIFTFSDTVPEGEARLPLDQRVRSSGPICNLDCTYCFFLDKVALYPGDRFRMSDEVLATYIR